jgi:hypothetical protein
MIGFAIKYLFISYFRHINFISGYFNQFYLLVVNLTIFILAIIISFMFILTIIYFAIKYLFIS